jgi:hypothetical protein
LARCASYIINTGFALACTGDTFIAFEVSINEAAKAFITIARHTTAGARFTFIIHEVVAIGAVETLLARAVQTIVRARSAPSTRYPILKDALITTTLGVTFDAVRTASMAFIFSKEIKLFTGGTLTLRSTGFALC